MFNGSQNRLLATFAIKKPMKLLISFQNYNLRRILRFKLTTIYLVLKTTATSIDSCKSNLIGEKVLCHSMHIPLPIIKEAVLEKTPWVVDYSLNIVNIDFFTF